MTLVVIDCQAGFAGARDPILIENCKKEIIRAVEKKKPVIFLEYQGHGSTIPQLKQLVRNYPFHSTLTKYSDGGGLQVVDTIFKEKYDKRRIRVCGLYSDFCVKDTVLEMEDYLPKSSRITIVEKACRGSSSNIKPFYWLSETKRTKLLRNKYAD